VPARRYRMRSRTPGAGWTKSLGMAQMMPPSRVHRPPTPGADAARYSSRAGGTCGPERHPAIREWLGSPVAAAAEVLRQSHNASHRQFGRVVSSREGWGDAVEAALGDASSVGAS
jgi:hypothetical protein